MYSIRNTIANLCPNMLHFDALDCSECRSKAVISLFWCCLVYCTQPYLDNTTPLLDSVVELEEIQDVAADLGHGADGLPPVLHQLEETIQERPPLGVRTQFILLVQLQGKHYHNGMNKVHISFMVKKLHMIIYACVCHGSTAYTATTNMWERHVR